MSSNLEIGRADVADIWYTGSSSVSARHRLGLAVTREPLRLKIAKNYLYGLGCIYFFKVFGEFEGP